MKYHETILFRRRINKRSQNKEITEHEIQFAKSFFWNKRKRNNNIYPFTQYHHVNAIVTMQLSKVNFVDGKQFVSTSQKEGVAFDICIALKIGISAKYTQYTTM